jgi:hypothetical protein
MGPEAGGQGPLFRELPSPRLLPYTEKPCLAQVWGGGGGEPAVKIYVAAVEALRKRERQDETQFTTKFGEQTSLGPIYLAL